MSNQKQTPPDQFKWPLLEKPARVGGGTFGKGVSSRIVVEAAQRLYDYEGSRASMTPEQRQEAEANRRKLWDMINGAPQQPAHEPVAWIEHGLVEAGDGLVWEMGTVGHYTPLYTAPPPATPAPHQPLVVQEPVGVVESAVQGCNGFHVKLRPGQDTPRIGTKLYAAPPVVQWTAADDTEVGEV